MNDTQALKEAVRKTNITIFGPHFQNTLSKHFDKPVKPGQTLGDLLTNVVAQLVQDPMYSEVLDSYRSRNPLTDDYSPICKQALDLYFGSLNR